MNIKLKAANASKLAKILHALNKHAKVLRDASYTARYSDKQFINAEKERLYALKTEVLNLFGNSTGRYHEFPYGGFGEELTIQGYGSFHSFHQNASRLLAHKVGITRDQEKMFVRALKKLVAKMLNLKPNEVEVSHNLMVGGYISLGGEAILKVSIIGVNDYPPMSKNYFRKYPRVERTYDAKYNRPLTKSGVTPEQLEVCLRRALINFFKIRDRTLIGVSKKIDINPIEGLISSENTSDTRWHIKHSLLLSRLCRMCRRAIG